VIGATINQDGILHVKATRVGSDTFLSHIIQLVEEAQGSKVPIQALADKITGIFVPAIIIISALSFVAWMKVSGDFVKSLATAIAVVVIACPCALGLATPTALMVGSGMGAKNGILIRKGEAIQTIKDAKIVVFDKTGTITKGKPEVQDFVTSIATAKFLAIAASMENNSDHPLARAVVEYAGLKKYLAVSSFKAIGGKGVEGKIAKARIVIGNALLMKEEGISTKAIDSQIARFQQSGFTAVIVAENKKAIGAIAIADAIKEDSARAIAYLNKQGYQTVMLTGDHKATANAIAQKAGISKVISEVLPEEKARQVAELQKQGAVIFVGDGINDAPALKQANVGIAMGTGTDIAIEVGDIVLTKGSLVGVVQAIQLSKATFNKIKQNLFWAFAYNVVAIPLAVSGMLSPVVAEMAMALSSVTVVVNANLLRRTRI